VYNNLYCILNHPPAGYAITQIITSSTHSYKATL
jgi:hypothetical protein